MVKNVPVPPDDRAKFALGDDEILQLARWACLIEEHYSTRRRRPMPMDIEWAKDGQTGELFIVQARPETVQSRKTAEDLVWPRAKMMMNVGNPEEAFTLSFIPNDGVGLAHEEFIITSHIRVHPLELYVMCEIPSNVLLAEEFADLFDGFSIGSNDLTQLVLGVDRDSEIVAPLFDERNPAVKQMIAQVIAVCRARKRKIGICGQAPSDYPEFAQFLMEQGIDSISLNPDTVLKTTLAIVEKEQALGAGTP